MSPNRDRVSEEPSDRDQPTTAGSVSWGSRRSESDHASRVGAPPGSGAEQGRCPSCGSDKTTVATSANRGRGSAIRQDNTGYRCFACGAGWTRALDDDRDEPRRS